MPKSRLLEHSLHVSDGDDVEFRGEQLGAASGPFEQDERTYNEDLTLYRTAGGKFVVHRSVDYSVDMSRDDVMIYDDAEDFQQNIKDYLGTTDAAKKIYEIASEAGVEVRAARRIE